MVGESQPNSPAPSTESPPIPPGALPSARPSLYVHLPFCKSRCRYCDFNAWAWRGQSFVELVDDLLLEAESRAAGLEPQTVFLGGGTPSLLPPEQILRLLDGLNSITEFRSSSCESTMEANPESFDSKAAEAALRGGLNRISIGAQSFRTPVLAAYDRPHGPKEIEGAVSAAKGAGISNINIDLIFGFPGQQPVEWEEDLRRAIDLGPQHLSCYELTFEPGTALTLKKEAGRIKPEDPDICAHLFEKTRDICGESGFERYEVSNFARPGMACLHNLAGWRRFPLVGIGPGAASWSKKAHRKNIEDPAKWRESLRSGGGGLGETAEPTPLVSLFEHLMMGLRLEREGASLDWAESISGVNAFDLPGKPVQKLINRCLLEIVDVGGERFLRATDRGFPLLDRILEDLLPEKGG